MNQEQLKSIIRWIISTFGVGIAAFVAGKGWASKETVLAALNSPYLMSLLLSIGGLTWGLFTHTQSNAVAVVGAMGADPASPVKGVVVMATPAGRELVANTEASNNASTVVTAGSPAAERIAKKEP